MLLRRNGWPEDGELVLCKITKVMPASVFVNLEEYGRSGMIHISEISPGRIRNIREFVSEGRIVVCKVLRIDQQKGHIDLSLRRVSEGSKRKKLEEIKVEQKAEKIVEFVAKQQKIEIRKLYNEIAEKVLPKYNSLHSAFEDISFNNVSLSSFGIDKKIAAELEEIIKQRIKPAEIIIGGTLKMVSYASDGIEKIKKALAPIEKNKYATIRYMGKGQFLVKVTSEDYKTAEKILKTLVDPVLSEMKTQDGEAEFIRAEG